MDYEFDRYVFQPCMNEIQSYSKKKKSSVGPNFSFGSQISHLGTKKFVLTELGRISVRNFFSKKASFLLLLLFPVVLPLVLHPKIQASATQHLTGNFEPNPVYASNEANYILKKVNNVNGSNNYIEKKTSPISISSKTKKLDILKTNKKFDALVGLGFSVQGCDSIPANHRLKNSLTTQFNETITALRPLSDQVLHNLWTPEETDKIETLVIDVKEGFLRHLSNLTELDDLDFLPAHELEQDENLAGILAKSPNNEPVSLTRAEFLAHHPNPEEEGQSDLDLIHAFIDLNASIRNPIVRRLHFFNTFPGNFNRLVDNLETLRTRLNSVNLGSQIEHLGIPKQTIQFDKSYSIGTLQIYSKPVLLDLSGSFSYTFRNHEIFLGVGKAVFRAFSSKSIGFIYGIDAGGRFSRSNSQYRYNGLGLRAFVGLGIAV